MNLKNWLYLFGTSLFIGMIAAVGTGIYFQAADPELRLNDVSVLAFNAGAGLMFSVLSQMGFFAYLTVNYIARAMFRRRIIWETFQWVLIVVVFIDMIVLRHMGFRENPAGLIAYSVLPVVLVLVSLAVAWWKVQMTNKTAFTPTVFFMFVATSLESVPALRENNAEATLFMIVPLLCCNAWQILNLHRLVQGPEKTN